MLRRYGYWAALLVAVVGYAFSAVHRQLSSGNDLPIYLDAARTLAEGGSPYNVGSGLHGYVYLPFLALVLTPLAFLPERAGIIAWYVANIALTVACFRCVQALVERSGFTRSSRLATALGFVIAGRFFLENYDLGQVNILILALILFAVRFASVERHDARAGVLLAIATVIKPHVVLVFAPFAVRKRWRLCLVGAAAFVCVALVVPGAVLGPARSATLLGEWYAQVVEPSLQGTLQGSSIWDQSPPAALRRWVVDAPAFGDAHVNFVSWTDERYRQATRLVQFAFLAVFATFWLTGRRHRHSPAIIVDAALALAAMVTIFGYSLKAHFVVLFLPAALLVAAARSSDAIGSARSRTGLATLAAVAGALVLFSSPGFVGRSASNWALAFSAILLATLLLVCGLVWIRRLLQICVERQGREVASHRQRGVLPTLHVHG